MVLTSWASAASAVTMLPASAQSLATAGAMENATISIAPASADVRTVTTKTLNGPVESLTARTLTQMDEALAQTPQKRITISNKWTNLGEGEWTDGLLNAIYITDVMTWKVTVMQNDDDPSIYKIVNPYTCANSPYAEFKTSNGNYDIILNAADPNNVEFIAQTSVGDYSCFDLGITVDPDLGSTVAYITDGNGRLAGGLLTMDPGKLYVGVTNVPGATLETHDQCKLLLPGAADRRISISSNDVCFDENKWLFTINATNAVSKIMLYYNPGVFPSTYANFEYSVSHGQAIDISYIEQNLQLPLNTHGWNTLFVVSCDNNGNIIDGATAYAYCTIHNEEEWTSRGMAAFNDDTFLQDYPKEYNVTEPVPTYYVELLENKEKPGLFRIVDPYLTHPLLNESNLHTSHRHYLDIDASNSSAVTIAKQPIGYVDPDNLAISLKSYDNGTYKNHVISFPQNGLEYYLHSMSSPIPANVKGNFSVTVPYTVVTVTVKDTEGKVLEGANVTLTDADGNAIEGATATTNNKGVATISLEKALAEGSTYNVVASKDGYEATDETATIAPANGTYEYTAEPVLSAKTNSITEINADANNGKVEIYTLQGVRINAVTTPGVYIVNGHKVYVVEE